MKRDPDVIRSILLAVERQSPVLSTALSIEGVASVVVQRHCALLMGSDYLDGRNDSTLRQHQLFLLGLTWKGHAFVETISGDDDWTAIRADLKMDERTVPFEVIEEFARRRSRALAGLPDVVQEPVMQPPTPDTNLEPEGAIDEEAVTTN